MSGGAPRTEAEQLDKRANEDGLDHLQKEVQRTPYEQKPARMNSLTCFPKTGPSETGIFHL